jgi:hypothetical protein
VRASVVALLLRRSSAAAAFPLLAAVAFYGCLRSQSLWLGDWAETSLQVRNSLVFSGPALAALGAWAADREARHGPSHLHRTGAVPRWHQLAAVWGAAAVWALAAYTAAAATTLLTSWSSSVWGAPSLSLLAAGALASLTYVTFGFAVGRLWPSLFAVPLAAVVVYGCGLAALENWTSPWRHLVPYNDDVITDGATYRGGLLAAQSVWLTGLLALSAVVALRKGLALTVRTAITAGVAATALLVGGAAAAVAEGGDFVRHQDIAVSDLTCDQGTPAVCLHPSRVSQLPAARGAVERLVEAFRGVRGLPARYVEAGVLSRVPADTLEFPLGDRGFDEDQVSLSIVDDMLYRAPCARAPVSAGGPSRGTVIEVWFLRHRSLGSGTQPPAVRDAVDRVDAMPAARRTAFFQQSLAASPDACAAGRTP